MGIGWGSKSCYTNADRNANGTAIAVPPNPSPDRWRLIECLEFENAYVLKVRYDDCTNYEGVKVMVYRGKYAYQIRLDPHFKPDNTAPIARFRPDEEGWNFAIALAKSL